jgi:hypothetical protein
MRDIGGNSYPIGPGSAIYAPPGIAGSHEWEICYHRFNSTPLLPM